MRFSKHGDVLAIALPESLRKKTGIGDQEEFEFVEVEDGILALVRKDKLHRLAAERVQNALKKENTAPPSNQLSSGLPAWHVHGFQVLEDETQAKVFSQQYEKLIKSGQLRGIRGFDKRFYLATSAFYETSASKILSGLKEKPKTAEQLSAESKLPVPACLTVLYLLKEEGEVLEKKRGEFSIVK